MPPKETIVNALATIDFPCVGIAPTGGFSASSKIAGILLSCTFEPSTTIPFAPKNDRIEQFCTYGDNVALVFPNCAVPPLL